jgi:glyoxylate reductase
MRVFATCDIGDALNILRQRGYDLEVYPKPEAPPKSLIIEKVKSGVDGLITTLRDPIDAEIFAAGDTTLKVVAQFAVGFDNINRADANQYKVPFTNTADVLTEATAEFAFFLMGALARKLWPAEHLTRENRWGYWHPYLPFLGDEVTGKTVAVIGTGRIGLAMIKKCAGFDMNIHRGHPGDDGSALPARHQPRENFNPLHDSERSFEYSRFHQPARSAATRGREHHADSSPHQRNHAAHDETHCHDREYVAWTGG